MCSGASIPVIEAVVVMVRRFALFFLHFLACFLYISLTVQGCSWGVGGVLFILFLGSVMSKPVRSCV